MKFLEKFFMNFFKNFVKCILKKIYRENHIGDRSEVRNRISWRKPLRNY